MTNPGIWFHVPFFLIYACTVGYEVYFNNLANLVPNSGGTFFESRFRFLTYWNFLLQTVFFGVCVIADIFAKGDKDHVLRRVQNRIMVSLAFPLAMFVGVTFWSIYLFDRELILPKAMDVFFPVWLNHCMHTNIMIFMLIEFLTTQYKHAPRARNLAILLTVMITYLVWLFVIYSATGVWVYPILHVLPWPLKIVFFIGCLGLVVGLYFAGEQLNRVLRTDKDLKAATASAATSAASIPRVASPGAGKKEMKKKRTM